MTRIRTLLLLLVVLGFLAPAIAIAEVPDPYDDPRRFPYDQPQAYPTEYSVLDYLEEYEVYGPVPPGNIGPLSSGGSSSSRSGAQPIGSGPTLGSGSAMMTASAGSGIDRADLDSRIRAARHALDG